MKHKRFCAAVALSVGVACAGWVLPYEARATSSESGYICSTVQCNGAYWPCYEKVDLQACVHCAGAGSATICVRNRKYTCKYNGTVHCGMKYDSVCSHSVCTGGLPLGDCYPKNCKDVPQ